MGLAAKHPLPQRGRFWSMRPDRLLQRHSHPHPGAPTHEALAPHPSPVAPPQGIRLSVPLWCSQFCPLSELGCPGAMLLSLPRLYHATSDFRPGSFSVLTPLMPVGP